MDEGHARKSFWVEIPPAVPTHFEVKPTLIMSLWCAAYSVAIIVFRSTGRWMRTERVWIEDVVILLSIPVLVARTTLITYVLDYGTNNVLESHLTGDEDIRRREIGSKLVLATRILYALYLWMNQLSVAIYIVRLTDQFWAAKSLTSKSSSGRAFKAFLSRHLNHIFYAFIAVGFIGVFVSQMSECRPFTANWQVVPTATLACRISPASLFNMGLFHVITDLALVALPMPMILSARLPAKIKVETLLLMLFPLIDVGFTSYRLPSIAINAGAQPHRTFMASLDILVSTASANSLVVISFLQDRGFKKLKYHYRDGDDGPIDGSQLLGPGPGVELKSIDPAPSAAILRAGKSRRVPLASLQSRPTWGSDEDLMRDDGDDGPPPPPSSSSLQTTSAGDAADPRNTCDVMMTPGVAIKKLTSTDHLSPAQKAETSIVASCRVDVPAPDENGASPSRSLPSRSQSVLSRTSLQKSQAQGILVETTWEVQRS